MTGQDLPTIGDLGQATAVDRLAPGRFALQVPDGWQQGRGAFGGLPLAALARAALATEPEPERGLRSFNAEIAGPVLPGEAQIEVTEVRRGSGLSSYTTLLTQDGKPLVRASAVLARARGTEPAAQHVPPPEPAPWETVAPIVTDGTPMPPFTRHLEMRPLGPLPFSGAAEGPVASGWVRLRRAPASLGSPEIVALSDAWWPAALATVSAFRPLATVAFALHFFHADPPLDPSLPVFHRGRVVAAQDGYLCELRELWSTDGRLVALNQQTIAWIR